VSIHHISIMKTHGIRCVHQVHVSVRNRNDAAKINLAQQRMMKNPARPGETGPPLGVTTARDLRDRQRRKRDQKGTKRQGTGDQTRWCVSLDVCGPTKTLHLINMHTVSTHRTCHTGVHVFIVPTESKEYESEADSMTRRQCLQV
jgi:hypothetical protein